MNGKRLIAIGGGLLLGLAGVVNADTSNTDQQAQIDALKAQVAELKGQQDANWLNERRTEEVKALVKEVLADADTRASLMGSAATAGHDTAGFFLMDDQNNFALFIKGMIDLRWEFNARQNVNANTGAADNNHGFEVTNAKLDFSGHIYSPDLTYEIRIAADKNTEVLTTERVIIGYQVTKELKVWGGEGDAPFLREQMVEYFKTLTVERSLIHALFTVGTAQGAGLVWNPVEMLKIQVMINDGFRSGTGGVSPTQAIVSQFATGKGSFDDRADFAITARVDAKIAGDWAMLDDYTSWDSDPMGIFVGAAIHYEVGKTGDAGLNNNFMEWTVDASGQNAGWSVSVAFVGAHSMIDNVLKNAGVPDVSVYGLVAQAAYNINDSVEPFIRYEGLYLHELRSKLGLALEEDNTNLLTFGANWFNHKHDAKATVDVVWALDPINPAVIGLTNGNTGLLPDAWGQKNQIVIRVQYQLLF